MSVPTESLFACAVQLAAASKVFEEIEKGGFVDGFKGENATARLIEKHYRAVRAAWDSCVNKTQD